MDNFILRWGIIGLGSIAHQFAKDLALLSNVELVAVASRYAEKAKEFAITHEVNKHYSNYEDIMADEEVDILYIATPHDSHASLSINAMEHGKHVLCEKPLAVNLSQVKNMIIASNANKVFLMEALWSRFNPSIAECLELSLAGAIGEVNYVNADFSFYREHDEEGRLLNMDLAGGSLLDVGIYPIFLAYSLFGIPEEIQAVSRFHKTGADIQTAVVLKFEKGIANIFCGFISQSDMVAKIYGTNGSILIDAVWHQTQGYTIVQNDKSRKVSKPTMGKGFTYEIIECIYCIKQGEIESQKWSHKNSLELMSILDEIRVLIDLKYPFEQ